MKKTTEKKKNEQRDILLFASPYASADMRWFAHFACGDPFLAFTARGKRIAAITALEIVRCRKESNFDEVLDMGAELAKMREKSPEAGIPEVIVELVSRYKVDSFLVPPDFPAGIFVMLTKLGLKLDVGGTPFFPQRVIKTEEELNFIRQGNRASCAGFKAVEAILKESVIDKKGFVNWRGKTLTSEILRVAIEHACLDAGGINVEGLIAASGDQGADCHCSGFGPIRANSLIVCDIFPRISATGYYGDMTRTYLKGKASPEQRKLVADVKKAHDEAIAKIKAGERGVEIYRGTVEFFKKLGYETGFKNGVPIGFFHGLGHGVGLDIHEAPNLGGRSFAAEALRENMVVTVEPGLYYPGIGGCRIEDVVVVKKDGCELLSKHPYKWEIA
ncbi:MAG: Xaa-Pro peptidase family protein [Opitutae bacterium]|nr:Xaa-Pro peptidase family protein [Opitutae bacterium]MCD8298341.1 Xaa-Pro peptidase family protein [Opitutae bacterium]